MYQFLSHQRQLFSPSDRFGAANGSNRSFDIMFSAHSCNMITVTQKVEQNREKTDDAEKNKFPDHLFDVDNRGRSTLTCECGR